MPVTINGTSGIVFNDATTQSTSNNLPANATNVLNVTAAASVGTVGTYAFLIRASNSGNTTGNALGAGGTVAGSAMLYVGEGVGAQTSTSSGTLAGTWRCMGHMPAVWDNYANTTNYGRTLFLRIS